MKITIYELLGLIKDGKAPEKIKYQDYCWEWTGDDYETRKFGVQKFLITGQEYTWVTDFLKDEVRVLEEVEDKEYEDIEELNLDTDKLLKKVVITAQDYVIEDKINALIRNQKYILERLDK